MFYVERSRDGRHWTALMAFPAQIGPDDFHGAPDRHVSDTTPGNVHALGGDIGWQVRVRCDDCLVELFEWAQIPLNPNDPHSDKAWGWKSIQRNHGAVAPHRAGDGIKVVG